MSERAPKHSKRAPEQKPSGPSRRGMLGLAATGLLLGTVGTKVVGTLLERESVLEGIRNRRKRIPLPPFVVNPRPHEETYDLEALGVADIPHGRVSGYLGLFKRKGNELTVSYPEILKENLWGKKVTEMEKDEPTKAPAMRLYAEEFAKEYRAFFELNQHEPTTLKHVLEETGEQNNTLLQALLWEKDPEEARLSIEALYGLTKEEVGAVRALAESLSGEKLLAYSLTELTPKNEHAELSVREYDFLLRTAGKKFLARVPSLHDYLLSFGQFQFTEFAIGKGKGASRANEALPGHLQLPESLPELGEYEEHTKAAYLFAVHNLATLMREVVRKEAAKTPRALIKILALKDRDLAELIGALHHSPKKAHDGVKAFLRDEPKKEMSAKDADTPEKPGFHTYLAKYKSVERYARITGKNFDALTEITV